ncbi:MAG TPA: hypothetical protein VGD37_08605 [Kofleriaceae bacterium]|jgi:hypothetical protein
MQRALAAQLIVGVSALSGACSNTGASSAPLSVSAPATPEVSPTPAGPPASPQPVPMSNTADANVPPHLRQFPGLSVRHGDQIVPASEGDLEVARGYPTTSAKGGWIDQRRLTLLTAHLRVRLGEPVRVIHVVETTRPGDQLYVMGPKPICGEYVDGALRTAAAPASGDPLAPAGLYDGRVLPAPAVDYNWDITEYSFASAGSHTIEWKLGPLVSNPLTIEAVP